MFPLAQILAPLPIISALVTQGPTAACDRIGFLQANGAVTEVCQFSGTGRTTYIMTRRPDFYVYQQDAPPAGTVWR